MAATAGWVIGVLALLLACALATILIMRARQPASPRAAAPERALPSAARFMSLLRTAGDILFLVDASGRVIEANDQALRTYGYTLEELQRLPPGSIAVSAAGTKDLGARVVHQRKDHSTFAVEISTTPLVLADGPCMLQICRDASATEAHQHQLERVNQLYALLRQLNQGIIRAESREELQQAVCHTFVSSGRFKLAWIGWRDPVTAAVRPEASAGDDDGYLEDIVVQADESPAGHGPTGTAIRENRTCVCNDFLGTSSTAPWQSLARRHGLNASIALPLHTGTGAVGALSVYAGQRNAFGPEEIALLEQCAADICFAFRNLADAASHQLAEERLVLLGTALESAPSAIAISDQHDTIEWVNPAFVASSGYTAEELAGRNSRQLRAEHQPGVSEGELWRTISSGKTWHGELISRRKNGQLYIEEATIVPIRDRAGAVRNFVSIRQDITGRKGAEQRIRQQAALLDQASEAIVVSDLTHRVTFWNRGAERLFGTTQAETIGKPILVAFTLADTIGSADFQQAIATPQDWRGEIRTHDRAGEPLVIETSITLLLDDSGPPTGRLYVCADITNKKALEEQFLRVQRMENIGMLAAGVAHDLNNVLAPMRMVGPLLRDRLTEARDLRLLDTLENCAIRGAALVRQILGFAHGITGEPRTVQVKHLLRDVVDVITATFPKSIMLEEEIPSDLWPINGNPTQIHQVLLNLCVNARDAMPDGGTLRLRALNRELTQAQIQGIEGAQPGPWLVVEVEDTGTGIPPEVLARMWEPLYTTKAADKGTGLGLSTVRGIVVQHHGFVTVDTALGRGSTFRVHFPVEDTAELAEGTVSPEAQPPAKGELILFVDDEASVREVAEAALTRHGYRVMTASDGAEAIGRFAPHSTEIALVVTDLDMPNFDGAALCRVIRTLNQRTKLLAISGFSSTGLTDPPGIAFLPKPFGLEVLLRKVDEVLHSPSAGE